jgi:hypothetical protein
MVAVNVIPLQRCRGSCGEHCYLSRFWLCLYYVKTLCNVAMLRNVKNLVIISEAHEETVFCTKFVKSAYNFF